MEIETYIQQQRRQGQLESEGAFTVDALAALRITLASALPEPHFYLFLLLQGLCAGGAQRVEVAIGRHSTRLGFEDAQKAFGDLEALRDRLARGLTLASPSALEMVLAGMATSVGQEMDRADLYGPNPDGAPHPALEISLRQAHVTAHPGGRPNSRSTIFLHRNVSSSQSFAWTRVWGGRREEGEILRRFSHSEPPVRVAGLDTAPGPVWTDPLDAVPGLGPIVLLEAAILADPDQSCHRAHSTHPMFPRADELGEEISAELYRQLGLPGEDGAHPTRCLFRRAFSGSGEAVRGELPPSAWQRRRWTLFATSHRQPKACVVWVRHGMTVERQWVELGRPGLFLIAPADGLDMDASGFALVHNDKLERRLEEARRLVETVGSSVGRDEVEQLMERVGRPQDAELVLTAFPELTG